ncbi:MAG TPA: YeeE/YedE thiosulfate transporter family protein [Anaeromyxobacteraceae bacterium]|nr:YeeE/YedE thiosulfate transporter family protein [Anaeromyxobacteraceae bacterium]
MKTEKPFWNPYAAGIVLGLVLLASFVLTGRGLGASGTFKHLGAAALHAADPTWAEDNGNIGSLFSPTRSSLDAWIVWLSVGAAIGGAASALAAGRFRVELLKGPRASREHRWIAAVAGGVLAGFGAQIARGCTSGQALTGGAQLALGSWVFMFSVFGGAYAVAWFARRLWI